jgi:hypothetical protein
MEEAENPLKSRHKLLVIMTRKLLSLRAGLLMAVFSCFSSFLFGQTTINTTVGSTGYTGTNGAGAGFAITFVISNQTSAGILLTDVANYWASGESGAVELWYSSTSLSGSYGTLATPTWTLAASGSENCTVSGVTPITWTGGLSLLIPANTTYRFALWSAAYCHYSGPTPLPTPDSFVSNGIALYVGDYQINSGYVGYGGSNNPRFFTGSITFSPATACIDPPTPGTATVSNANPCTGGNITLNLTGNTSGTGQTYQWQSSTASTGPWTNVGSSSGGSSLTIQASGTLYYRAAVTCGATTAYSAPVLVTVPAPFPGGSYTINSALTTGGTNFQTFAAAISAISCGISGPIVFDVVPGSGPYNEQISIPAIGGSSSVNTVTIHGHGATLSYGSTLSSAPSTLELNDADHILIDSLNISATGPTYAFACHLWNQADSNTFTNCTFTVPANGTSTTQVPFSISGSATSATTSGISGNSNLITGCTMNSGYYNTTIVGNSGTNSTNNKVINCNHRDFYIYGNYIYYQTDAVFSGNTVERPTRTTLSTFYGYYLGTNNFNLLVEKNRIRSPFDGLPTSTSTAYGIYAPGSAVSASPNNIINNVIYGMNGSGTQGGIYLSGANYYHLYHNTISLDYSAATAGTTYGIYCSGTIGDTIKNNIINITRGGSGTKYCLYYTGSAIVSDNNDLYINSPAGTNYTGYYGSGFITLASWQTANAGAWDANSLNLNPLFASANTGDFTPTSALLDNTGTPVGVLTDLLNNSRSVTTPDIGAVEFSVPPCSGTPVAGTATGPAGTSCPYTSFNLSLSGYSIATGITIQWESSPAGTNTWTPIAGANLPNYTVLAGVTANTDFRAVVTCTASSTSTTSNTVAVSVYTPFAGGTYTIDATQPASSTNFQNFTALAAALNCAISGPVVVNVVSGSGPYNEQFLLNSIGNTSATNTITINGNGETITYLSSNTNERGIIRLNGTNYVTVNNLKIVGYSTNTAQYAWGVFMTNNADSNTISNCQITLDTLGTSTNFCGIVLSGSPTSATTSGSNCDGNIFSGNTIKGGYYGMTLMGVSSGALNDNQVINNTIQDFYLYGLYSSYSFNQQIKGNNISRPYRTNISTFYGVYLTTGNTKVTVMNNRIHDPAPASPSSSFTMYGIYLTSSASTAGNENMIVNNEFYNLQGTGSHYLLYNSTSGYTRYLHNTLNSDYTAATAGATYSIYQTGTTTGMDYRNNIIKVTRGGTGAKYGIYMPTSPSAWTSDHNDIYINGANTATNYTGYYSSTARVTLGDWQTATLRDSNSVAIDPVFAAPQSGDLAPTNASVDDLGTPVGITSDINNNTRSATTPDMGAVEFSIPPCVGTPTAGIASGPATACSGVNITLNLTGFTIGNGISIQWESSPSGTSTWTPITGATSNTITVSQTAAMDYHAIVTCANGGGNDVSNTVSVGMSPFYICYCSPLTGVNLNTSTFNYLTGVSISSTTLNNPNTSSGYTQWYPTTTNTTGSIAQGVQYTINTTHYYSAYYSFAWIDFDGNGTFDATEYIPITTTGYNGSGTFTVPFTSYTGLTGMRVRHYYTTGMTASSACTPSVSYETEDYVITILPQPSCFPPTGLTATNITSSSADVSWAAVTGAAGYQWAVDQSNTAAPGASTTINSVTTNATQNVSGLTSASTYYLHVLTDCGATNGLSTWSMISFNTMVTNDSCSGAIAIPWNGSITGNNTLATNDVLPAVTCGSTGSNFKGLWYTVTPVSSGNMTVSMCGSFPSWDSYMRIYTGTCGNLTACAGFDDDGCGGGGFSTLTINAVANTTYYVLVTGYSATGFGSFNLNVTGVPLSIKLNDIAAVNVGARNRINWSSASEEPGDSYVVERSADGQKFNSIATVNGNGKASAYTYWDEKPVTGINYYRLKMTDGSGNAAYSKTVTANLKSDNFSIAAYPNPVTDVLKVKMYGTAGSNQLVTLTDVTGKVLKIYSVIDNNVSIQMSAFPSGVYLVKYSDSKYAEMIKINKD